MTQFDVQRRSDAEFEDAYGCRFWRIFPWQERGPSDEGAGLAIIPPGGSSEPHAHEEVEQFFVVRGAGNIRVEGTARAVGDGDVIVVGPWQSHHFENDSDREALEVLCVWTAGPFGEAGS